MRVGQQHSGHCDSANVTQRQQVQKMMHSFIHSFYCMSASVSVGLGEGGVAHSFHVSVCGSQEEQTAVLLVSPFVP